MPSLPLVSSRMPRCGKAKQRCRSRRATRVPEWLSSIDIFVLPSRTEAFSNSLMEAMACGCCAVASDVGGNPELVKPGETGLLFKPQDPDDLAAQLQTLIENPDLRRDLAARDEAFLANFSI